MALKKAEVFCCSDVKTVVLRFICYSSSAQLINNSTVTLVTDTMIKCAFEDGIIYCLSVVLWVEIQVRVMVRFSWLFAFGGFFM